VFFGTRDIASGVAVDTAGDVIAAGGLYNVGTGLDLFVVKLAGATGAEEWTFTDTAVAGDADSARAVALDSNGDVVVISGAAGGTVLKLAGADGTELWRAAPVPAAGLAIAAGDDVVVSGGGGPSLARLAAADGAETWSRSFAGLVSLRAVALGPTGDVFATGLSSYAEPAFGMVRVAGDTGAPDWQVRLSGSADDGAGSGDERVVAVGADGVPVAVGVQWTATGRAGASRSAGAGPSRSPAGGPATSRSTSPAAGAASRSGCRSAARRAPTTAWSSAGR
jgi:hypothetical protein